ncbi:MAG TPA: peptide-methionine (S)-S-oxide reductase MsrA [Candidatus Binataceae bacterium]|jgi:peptide-methionine (S)-S-oxide reductase|nr:peptide-methionine (S)-S-oxide reductase MsrA [Candidatus Binataceae bacterium]
MNISGYGIERRSEGSTGDCTGILSRGSTRGKIRSTFWLCPVIIVVLAMRLFGSPAALAQSLSPASVSPAAGNQATAVMAGGCFWGVDGVFKHVKGVTKVVSGYAGGSAANAQYEIVSTGTTGHAESVQITYMPSVVSYQQLLQVFFLVAHDPTELDRQGPDEGTQYRSVIFYTNNDQKRIADNYIAELNKEKVFSSPIVTEVVPLDHFYPAEDYHQNFLELHPDNPYIVANDLPKLKDLKRQFPALCKPQA